MIQRSKYKLVYSCTVIVLTIALLTPYFVKIAHAFESHKHEVCTSPLQSHFHELDWDCEFYKFKLDTQYSISFLQLDSLIVLPSFGIAAENEVEVFQSIQDLNFRRGPPILV